MHLTVVSERGPQDEISVEEGPAAVCGGERRGDRRQFCDHQGAQPTVLQGPGHHTGQQPEKRLARHDLHD